MSDLVPDVSDDLTHGILAGLADAQQSAARQRLRAFRGDTPKEPEPASVPAFEPGKTSAGQRLVAAPVLGSLGQGLLSGLMAGGGNVGAEGVGPVVGGTAPAVAKDMAMGMLDAPRQIIGGGLDFVNNIVNFADVAVKQADAAGVPNIYFRLFDDGGKWSPSVQSAEEFRKAQAAGDQRIFQVPTTGKGEEVTGHIIRMAVPFLLGRGTSGSPLARLGGSLPGEVARDAISGVISQNTSEPRLSNIIESVAPNAITGFLQAKPEDEGTILGHVKSGLEYAGLSALVGGTLRALKALKESGAGQKLLAESGDDLLGGAPAQPSGAAGPAVSTPATAAPTRDILALGDPLEPAVTIRPTARDAAMAEVTAGRMSITPSDPGSIGPAAGMQGIPRATEGALPHVAVPREPMRLASWLVRRGGLRDQSGEVSHITDIRARPGLISGKGMTLGDAARSAWEEGYLSGAARPTPDDLIAALGDDLAGRARYRAVDADAVNRFSSAVTRNVEIDRIGDELGIPTRNIRSADFWDEVANRLSQEHGEKLTIVDAANKEAMDAASARLTGRARTASAPASVAPPPEPSVMSEETISAYLSGAQVDNPVKVNLSRIGSNEDIADALAQVSKTIPKQAIQTNQATVALADAMGLQPADLLKGYKGQNLGAAEITAMRFMLDSSGEQLVKFAEAARDPLAGAEAKGQFLRAFTTHRALQAYAENARAEAGRSLQAWSILSQQREGFSRNIADLIRNADGVNGDLTAMAEQIATVGNGLQASRFVANTMRSGSDVLMTAWYNALLSSPTTLVKNVASDFAMATWNTVTTGLAEKLGSGNVVAGETEKLLQGYVGGFKDALRAAGRAARAGESQFYGQYNSLDALKGGGGLNAASRRFNNSLALNGFPETFNPEGQTEAAGSAMKAMLPTSWLSGENDFVKLWNYRAELRRLNWRASGGDAAAFRQLMDNPPAQVHQQALAAALKQGFQEPLGPTGEAMMAARDGLTVMLPHTEFEIPLGRMIVPFLRTPLNLLKTAAVNSPVGLLMREPQRIIAGGASPERDILIAKIGLGSAVALSLADMALNNYITGKGPNNPANNRAWRAAGNRPYSLQIPGYPAIQMNQVDPLGIVFGAIADTFNILKFSEDDDMDTGTLVSSLVLGIGNAMLSKSYLQGLSDFFQAMDEPQREGSRWMERLGGTVVPSGVARIARATDEWERAHYGFLDSLETRLPWVREGLPPQRTLWGDPVPVDKAFLPFLSSKAANIVSPLRVGPSAEEVQPIDKWIWDNRAAFPIGARGEPRLPSRMGRTQPFVERGISLSVQLTPQQYDRLQVLAGNELKGSEGLGAKDVLNSLVEGRHPSESMQRQWNEATAEMRALEVSKIVRNYQAAARQQLLVDYPDLRALVEDGLKARAGALTGRPQ